METTNWTLDPVHSEVQFKVKHMMISNVTGSFRVFNSDLKANEDFSHAEVSFSAEARSISTGNEQRDGHLKSADFFDVEKHPAISFAGKNFNAKEGKINGNLTIKGVTKPVSLQVEFNGTNKDPYGNFKAGFSIHGKINRKDWGLTWNAALETGGLMVSEEVKVEAELQFVRK